MTWDSSLPVEAPPDALLLDMDDTLVQYDVIAGACWSDACASCLDPTSSLTPAAAVAAIQAYTAWYWSDPERHRRGRLALDQTRREMVAAALAPLGCDPVLAEQVAATYQRLRTDRLALFPDTIGALTSLRRRVPKMALVTNGDTDGQRAKIARFGLASYFDCIYIEGELGFGKPDLRCYEHVLGELGVAPDQALMVGDNIEWDVAAPQRLGITGVWLDVRGTGLPADSSVKPDRIIRRLSDLLADGLLVCRPS